MDCPCRSARNGSDFDDQCGPCVEANSPTAVVGRELVESLADPEPAPVADYHDVRATRDLLNLASVYPSYGTVRDWTPEERAEADAWAGAVHLHASDNDVAVPPCPAHVEAFVIKPNVAHHADCVCSACEIPF